MSTFGRLLGGILRKRGAAPVADQDGANIEEALERGDAARARALIDSRGAPDQDARRDRWLALLAALEGRHGDAMPLFERVLAREPRDAALLVAAGTSARAAGLPLDAVRFWKLASDLAPGMPGLRFNIAAALWNAGRHAEALEEARQAGQEMPGDVRPMLLVGAILESMGNPAALGIYAGVLESSPADADAWAGTGRVLREAGRFADAADAFARAGPQWMLDHALALFHTRRFDAAISRLDALLADQPGRADAALVRANALLARGSMAEGWRAYEARLRMAGTVWSTRGVLPWDGARIDGTLVVDCEQGFGDCFLGARFLAAARRRVGRLVLRCPPSLVALFEASELADAVIASGVDAAAHAHAFLLSLPALVGIDDASCEAGYLRAPDDRVAEWRKRLAGQKPAVGLVWSGAHEASQNRHRTFDPEPLARMLSADFRLYSLQLPAPGIAACPAGVVDLAPELTDFAATAAALMALDGLVSAETSVAHLAGALGARAVVPLPITADWRWEIAGRQNPWYTTLHTPRLRHPGDWTALWPEVAARLSAARN